VPAKVPRCLPYRPGCPRCVAERRAGWVRVATNLSLVAVLGLLILACCCACGSLGLPDIPAQMSPQEFAVIEADRAKDPWRLVLVAWVLAYLTAGLCLGSRHLTRDAAADAVVDVSLDAPGEARVDAPGPGARGRVGPAGGTFGGGGVSVVVPPGALDREVDLEIATTVLPIPAGYRGYSAVYRARPEGLTFARPLVVTVEFAGDAARAQLHWSRAAGGGYESLGGTVTGNLITAAVQHFSTGFVGAEERDGGAPDGALSPDVPAALDARPEPSDALTDVPTSLDASAPDAGGLPDAPTAALPAPRPLAPLPMAGVTTWRPTLRWALAPGADGARVQICRDRACATVERTFDAAGDRAAPPADLTPGVHFWRLRARAGAALGVASSPVWSFVVGRRSTPVDSARGATPDFDGDGRADLVVGAERYAEGTGRVYVYPGRAGGVGPHTRLTGPDGISRGFGAVLVTPGDVNGDGYGDLVVGMRNNRGTPVRLHVYHGGPAGLPTEPTASIDGVGGAASAASAAGDVNGDGYADLVVGPVGLSVRLYFGSATGLPATPSQTLALPDSTNLFGVGVAGVGDLNGDGRGDLVVSAPLRCATPGSPEAGVHHVFVYLGGATGAPASPSADLHMPGGCPENIMLPVTALGDTDGDGYADFGVENGYTSVPHRLTIFRGGTALPTVGAGRVLMTGRESFIRVAALGDVNGDGYGDVLVGSGQTGSAAGWARFYLGGGAGLPDVANATRTAPSAAAYDFGMSVAGLGDLDGDGFDDAAVGSWSDGVGRVHVYQGAASGPSAAEWFVLRGLDGEASGYGGVLARRPVPPAGRGGRALTSRRLRLAWSAR